MSKFVIETLKHGLNVYSSFFQGYRDILKRLIENKKVASAATGWAQAPAAGIKPIPARGPPPTTASS